MKSFVICLSRIPASIATAQEVLKTLLAFGMDAELFEGSYGDETLALFKKERRVVHDWTFKGPSRLISPASKEKIFQPGVAGCFYSHYRLWQKCVELDQPIMILEDDVIFTRPYEPVAWQDVLITVLGNETKSAKYNHFLTDPDNIPSAQPYYQASMPGTPGYAIKPHAASKLLRAYEKTFLPSDNAINKHHVQIEIHSKIMGRAMVERDGKKSLVRGPNLWNKNED